MRLFEEPKIEIITMAVEDIVATSGREDEGDLDLAIDTSFELPLTRAR